TLYPLVFDSSLPHPYPPSFPTRRSSDLPHRRLRLLLTGALVRLWSRGSEALGDLASHLHRHGHLEEVNVGAYRLPGGQPPLRPHQQLGDVVGEPRADDPGRDASHDRVRRDVARNHRSGPDHGPGTDLDSGQYHHVRPYPDVVSDCRPVRLASPILRYEAQAADIRERRDRGVREGMADRVDGGVPRDRAVATERGVHDLGVTPDRGVRADLRVPYVREVGEPHPFMQDAAPRSGRRGHGDTWGDPVRAPDAGQVDTRS